MQESGRKLTGDLTVDHLCGNKQCDCKANFHLLILPTAMAHHLDNGGKGIPKGRRNYVGVG